MNTDHIDLFFAHAVRDAAIMDSGMREWAEEQKALQNVHLLRTQLDYYEIQSPISGVEDMNTPVLYLRIYLKKGILVKMISHVPNLRPF